MTDKIHYPILFGVSPRKRNTKLWDLDLIISDKTLYSQYLYCVFTFIVNIFIDIRYKGKGPTRST